MRKYSVTQTEDQLIISRNRAIDILSYCANLATTIALVCFLLWVHTSHHDIPTSMPLTAFGLLVFDFVGVRALYLALRRREFILDRSTSKVMVNGFHVYYLEDLQSVCLERSFSTRGDTTYLSLQTKSKVKIDVAMNGVFGVSITEMRSLAETIANFTKIDLIAPDEFISGDQETDERTASELIASQEDDAKRAI